MGLNFFNSSSSYEEPKVVGEVTGLPNPNPANYNVIRSVVINEYLVIELKYHDCTNYEGQKIMVYNCALEDLMKQKLIDPHFCESNVYFSPIARFEPTERGWKYACCFVNNISK